jgi:integrin beta 3
LRLVRGDHVKTFGAFTLPVQIYRGVWQDGKTYTHQDAVTWGGSQWVCVAPTTTAKPGLADAESRAWTLAVKAGRDGKHGKDGDRGPEGKEGKPGRDGKW